VENKNQEYWLYYVGQTIGRAGPARDIRIRRAREGLEFGGKIGECLNRDDYKGSIYYRRLRALYLCRTSFVA
jgi:hypothetical protein